MAPKRSKRTNEGEAVKKPKSEAEEEAEQVIQQPIDYETKLNGLKKKIHDLENEMSNLTEEKIKGRVEQKQKELQSALNKEIKMKRLQNEKLVQQEQHILNSTKRATEQQLESSKNDLALLENHNSKEFTDLCEADRKVYAVVKSFPPTRRVFKKGAFDWTQRMHDPDRIDIGSDLTPTIATLTAIFKLTHPDLKCFTTDENFIVFKPLPEEENKTVFVVKMKRSNNWDTPTYYYRIVYPNEVGGDPMTCDLNRDLFQLHSDKFPQNPEGMKIRFIPN
jgi:hypothetical protein